LCGIFLFFFLSPSFSRRFAAEANETENASAGQPNKELTSLRKRVQELAEENNMLKFKVEVLLDMVGILVFFCVCCRTRVGTPRDWRVPGRRV
jgi:hypothetical protein